MSKFDYNRRDFIKAVGACAVSLAHALPGGAGLASLGCQNSHRWFRSGTVKERPNILFALADDWSWPHTSIAGDRVVKTPTFDRVAREGVMFSNAFVTASSCTPSRGSILTGQWHWRLEQGCNLHSTLPAKFDVYPDLLEQAGYHIGFSRKGWGPGRIEPGGRKRNPAGPKFKNFTEFLKARGQNKPFCFWFGSTDPHRPYTWQSGVKSGMNIKNVDVPASLPDSETVRTDICDYYCQIQRFDRQVGQLLKILEENGELNNTLVAISGDNGMPFPWCKSNLYDLGTHVPLAVRWPAPLRQGRGWPQAVKGGRVVEDFISLSDLAPTFLQAASLEPTGDMTARSFLDILTSGKSGQVDPKRDKVLTGKERHHGKCREKGVGYPMRAIRTHQFLYIRNFKPQRWPAGSPDLISSQGTYSDVDSSPTKDYMISHRNDPKVRKLFEKAFDKRPAEELYDLRKDPGQMHNVAQVSEYDEVKGKLAAKLMTELTATQDPRVLDKGDVFDNYPYLASYGMRRRDGEQL